MRRFALALALSVAALCPALAQAESGGALVVQPDTQQSANSDQPNTTGQGTMEHGMGGGMMGRGGMMGGGGARMMGRARASHSLMMHMIFALIDSDGDGSISLQEFQAAHEHIFKAMDSNKDGRLSLEEMQNFMHGGLGPAQAR